MVPRRMLESCLASVVAWRNAGRIVVVIVSGRERGDIHRLITAFFARARWTSYYVFDARVNPGTFFPTLPSRV